MKRETHIHIIHNHIHIIELYIFRIISTLNLINNMLIFSFLSLIIKCNNLCVYKNLDYKYSVTKSMKCSKKNLIYYVN